jgi:hypothetical protein
MTDHAAVFAAVFAAIAVGHQVGDYWVQTDAQARSKGLPGWPGRRACASHVVTHTAALAVFTAAAWLALDLPLSPLWVVAGLAVNAASHYFADRRTPLRHLAERTGHGGFWHSGVSVATGGAYMDQAWHWAWLFAAALLISGGIR